MESKPVALVDVNNFYASCERVFNPSPDISPAPRFGWIDMPNRFFVMPAGALDQVLIK